MPDALHPFPYDAFQQEAIHHLDQGISLFVAAPTGSGKTVLADYVIDRALASGRRVIYTAPIKALSNQKYRDFTARYGERVGILTGDVTINARAPLVIMTTEIYRNTLLEDTDPLAAYAWVIFDEVHYLDDPERGTVWEEALLFTPSHINLLCLSATIPNVEPIAAWIRRIHGRPVAVVEESHRPVPLHLRFQCHNRILHSEEELRAVGFSQASREAGRPLRRHGSRAAPHGSRWRHRHHLESHAPANRIQPLLQHLLKADHLPCILFTFGRRRAEDLAWEAASLPFLDDTERVQVRRLFRDLCNRFSLSHDRTAEALSHLLDRGVAYHHAGMLPTMKEVVERCFTSRLVKCIVTTETFALGINMPARSVILDALTKRSGESFAPLRRREFLQMAGRAGRRGMDEAGYVYVRVNPVHVRPAELHQMLHGEPEPVLSRFNTTYATLLNLYRRDGAKLVELYPRTLYYAQSQDARRQAGLETLQRKLDLLTAMGYTTPHGLTRAGEFASYLYGYELLLTELYRDGALDGLDPLALAVLLAGAVYEPRPRVTVPRLPRTAKALATLCETPLARIHREETRHRISPKTRAPCFHLAHALEAWMAQTPFAKVIRLCPVDEGEIVRYFRMTVQLLRQFSQAPAADPDLRERAQRALRRINRDVVDAEAQLRMG